MTGIRDNPYVGPRPFSLGQRLYGRDRELRELFDLLVARRIVLLHSPSGAGKSSLVQAGLIPRLKREGFDVWRTIRLNLDPDALPGAAGNRFVASTRASLEDGVPEAHRRDLAEIGDLSLADYLRDRPRRSGAPPSVALIFDQFEEILTVDPLDVDAKREFFSQVGEALRQDDVWTLFALREDYLAALSPYRDLVPTRLANAYRIDLLGREAALEAIARPARDGGREFPAAELLADDLRTVRVQQPDGSFAPEKGPYVEPMHLQVVCRRLWQAMPEDDLSIDAEDLELGNVDEALADYYRDSVERVAGGSIVHERLVREWFGQRLIAAAGVRAQVLRGEEASGGLANELIESLLDSHLIRAEKRAGATWYELAHDRLVEAVRGDNADWRGRHLSEVQRRASLWEREDRAPGMLLRDDALAEAERWAADNEAGLTDVEKRFLSASRKAQNAADRERRQALWIKGLAVMAMIVAIVAAWQWWQAEAQRRSAEQAQRRAERQARIATSGRLANAALLNVYRQLDLASLLALEAGNVADTFEARHALLSTAQSNPQAITYLRQPGFPYSLDNVAVSPDGTMVAAGTDVEVYLWDVASRQPLGEPLRDDGGISSIAFSPDGALLAGGIDEGRVRLWRTASREPSGEPLEVEGKVTSVAFSPDGAVLAAAAYGGVKLWDVASRRPLAELTAGGTVSSLAFSRNGAVLAGSVGNTAQFWDVETRQSVGGLRVADAGETIAGVAIDPNDMLVASAVGNAVKLWDIARGQQLVALAVDDGSWLRCLAFSPDGTYLATGGGNSLVRLWHVASRRYVPFTGHSGEVNSVAFSADGAMLATTSDDQTLRLWHVAGRSSLAETLIQQADVSSVAFSPDGGTLAVADAGSVQLWDVAGRQPRASLGGFDGRVHSIAFSPDGRTLLSGGEDMAARLWDLASGEVLGERLVHDQEVSSVAFSPSGEIFATGSSGGAARLWEAASRQPSGAPFDHGERIFSLAFSPDGAILATGGMGGAIKKGMVRLWEVSSRLPLGPPLEHGTAVCSVAFSPDGASLVSGSIEKNKTLRLWDVAAHEARGEAFGHGGYGAGVAFSPDGSVIASEHQGTVWLWDVASRQPLGEALVRQAGLVSSVAFSPDGRMLAIGSYDGPIWLADVDPDSWRARNCRRANRNLSLTEWRQYLGPDVPYRVTCPDLPPGEGVEGE